MANKAVSLNVAQEEAVLWGQGPLLIIAGAGTGKTTVVTERIKHLILNQGIAPSEILALTFTEKAAREMQERVDVAMPYGYTQMWISTFHSFGDRILKNDGVQIGLDPRYRVMTEAEAINFMRKHIFDFELSYFRPLGNPTKFLSGIFQHFSRLQDEDITPAQYLDWARMTNDKCPMSNAPEKKEADKWVELAKAYAKYEELKNKNGLMDFSDLIYNTLRLFRERTNVLATYKKAFKYILVDEFQDTNIAQYELIKLLASSEKDANLTIVGDDSQCLPGGSRVETPSGLRKISEMKKGDIVFTAVGKGHTSTSRVLKVFKSRRTAVLLTFKVEDGEEITVTSNHKMFCFLPALYMSFGWHFVYLMHQVNLGWRIGVTNSLPARLRLERHADKIIAIGAYKTDQEARFFEAYFSAKYGLPTIPFTARPGQAINGEWLVKLFKDIDTNKNAQILAKDLNLELDSPVCLTGGVVRGSTTRIKVNLEMCYRNHRGKTHKNGFLGSPAVLHQVSVETSDPKAINALKRNGFPPLKAKKGWRVRIATTDLAKAWNVAKKLMEITNGILDKKFNVGLYNYQHLSSKIVPASHVFPGMYLPVLKGKSIIYRKVISREEIKKTEDVYDLEIDKTHNFIADKIVVHNSIYKFRGAAISNILHFIDDYKNAKQVVLTENYRSTQSILDSAYKLIQFNNPDTLEAKLGVTKNLQSTRRKNHVAPEFIHADRVENEAEMVAKKIKYLSGEEKRKYSDFAILVRANNHAEPFVRALARAGIPYQFLGPGQLFRQPEIKEIFCYLKVLTNFEDSAAFYKVLTMEHLGFLQRDIASLVNYSRKNNLSLFEAAEKIDDVFINSATREKIKNLVEMIHRHMQLIPKETAGQILYYFFQDSGLLNHVVNPKNSLDEKRAQNIARFFDKLKSYEGEHEDASVFAVVDWIELSLDLGESPRASDFDWSSENAVNILTIHSSKGLEFPVVFVVNMVDARFPTRERREQIPIPEELIKEVLPQGNYHLQEERRLAYVAATRAKDRLYFTAADYYGEGKREKKVSLFVPEALGEEVLSMAATKGEQLSILEYSPLPQSHNPPASQRGEQSTTIPPITYLSYSQIDCFRFCPLHYKMKYILRIPTPTSPAQSFGISLHNTMKDFHELAKGGNPLGEKEILEIYERDWIRSGYLSKSHEQKTKEQGKEYLVEYLKTDLHNPKNLPVDLEKPFIFPIGPGLKLGGKIDRIDKTFDGGIEIIDYKTTDLETKGPPTERELEKDLQLSFYALAAVEVRDPVFTVDTDKIILSLYFFNKALKVSTTRTKKQLEEAKQEILKAKQEIETSDFFCSGNLWCRECEFKLFCEAA
ncbi:MAG: UvrD-helicase domain-containing protein [Candidatus Blackburnbacteria bacterium]|nr:UvrD-helicase domain-containing protein [Candidatus Blackburnbacteria bacterium]